MEQLQSKKDETNNNNLLNPTKILKILKISKSQNIEAGIYILMSVVGGPQEGYKIYKIPPPRPVYFSNTCLVEQTKIKMGNFKKSLTTYTQGRPANATLFFRICYSAQKTGNNKETFGTWKQHQNRKSQSFLVVSLTLIKICHLYFRLL